MRRSTPTSAASRRKPAIMLRRSSPIAIHICDEFVKAGVRAEHLDGSTPVDDRNAILARLGSGETEIVTNCMVLTEGFDCPDVGCIILARPTKKMGLFRQMIGRGLRPAEGKSDVVILDHSGAVFRHGLPEDRVDWTLDPDRRAISPEHVKRQSRNESKLIECTQCGTLRVGGMPCPSCGFLPRRPAEFVATAAGDLGLVQGGKARVHYSQHDRAAWHGMLAHIAAERGYKPGWVGHKYKEKFGTWPASGAMPELLKPTLEVLSWVRSRAIAFAKARRAA
jgi:DNA repair protein RadD